jgi:hypothetical protein
MKTTAVVAAAAALVALLMGAGEAQPAFGSALGGAYDELLPILVRGRTFVPSFKTRLEYDDNIFTAETDPVEQWKFVIEPKFDIHFLRELSYYGFSYQYSLQVYEDRDPSTDQSHDAALTLNHKFSDRIEVRVRDRYRHMNEPELVEVTVEEGTTDQRVVTQRLRNDRDYNVLSPSLIFRAAPKLYTNVSYEHLWLDYEDEQVSITGDRTQQSGSLGANYILTPKTYLTFYYRYNDIDYKSDEIKVDSTSNIVALGASHQFSATLSGNLRAGAERREYADYTRTAADGSQELVSGQEQTAPYISASLRAPMSETLATELGYTYRIEETTEAAFLSQELQSVYLGISQSFTDRFSAVFNATLDYGDYKIDEARYPNTQSNFQEQTLLFALVFRYRFKPNWHAEIGWRFTDTDSDFPGQSYTRNRTFIGISAIF